MRAYSIDTGDSSEEDDAAPEATLSVDSIR